MDNTDKIKDEIRAILNSATDKELTKQWIVEALDEGLNHYVMKVESGNYKVKENEAEINITLPSLTFDCSATVTETAPSYIDKCEVKVDPDSKSSVKSKVMSIVGNQLAGQVIRELIERIGAWL